MNEPILIVLSIAMFLGAYIAGCLPLFLSLDQRKIRLASVFGAGLLIGTALCIIIPEGISTLTQSPYTVRHHSPPNEYENPLNIGPNPVNPKVDFQSDGKSANGQIAGIVDAAPNQPNVLGNPALRVPGKVIVKRAIVPGPPGDNKNNLFVVDGGAVDDAKLDVKRAPAFPLVEKALHAADQQEQQQKIASNKKNASRKTSSDGLASDEQHSAQTSAIGRSLLFGFLFMFLVDQFAHRSAKASRMGRASVPTLGLVIHAAADGLALGSASGSVNNGMQLQILVFVAIMLHKAPAAFALVSFLILEGLERHRVRRHLLAFSLAAPLAALATSFLLNDARIGLLSGPYHTGVILLFSGGTFLYIATVHILPELIDGRSNSHHRTASGTMPKTVLPTNSASSRSVGGGSSGATGDYSLLVASSSSSSSSSTSPASLVSITPSPRLSGRSPAAAATTAAAAAAAAFGGGASGGFSMFELLLFCVSAIIPALIAAHDYAHGGGGGGGDDHAHHETE